MHEVYHLGQSTDGTEDAEPVTDYNAMRASGEYFELVLDMAELQKVVRTCLPPPLPPLPQRSHIHVLLLPSSPFYSFDLCPVPCDLCPVTCDM